MTTLQQPIILRGHIDEVTSVYFDQSDYNNLFSGDLKGNFNLFNLETRRVKHSIPHHHNGCILGFYQHLNHLYSQGRDGSIKRIDLNHLSNTSNTTTSTIHNNSESTQRITENSEWLYNSIFSFCKFVPCKMFDEGMCFFVPSDKEQVMLLDCRERQTLESFRNNKPLMISPPKYEMTSGVGGGDGAGSGEFGMLTGMSSIDNSQYLLCSYESGVIVEFDIRKLREPTMILKEYEIEKGGESDYFCTHRDLIHVRHVYDLNNAQDPIIALNYQSGLENIIVGTSSTQIHVIDRMKESTMNSREQSRYSFELKSPGVNDISCLSNSTTSKTLMSRLMFAGCWDGNVRVFDLRKKKKLAVYKYHETAIRSLDFKETSSNEILLAAGCKDSKISVWNVNFETKRNKN